MRKPLLILSGAVCAFLASFLIITTNNVEDERTAYEAFLKGHEYKARPHMNKKELKSIPKYDRPDLGFEQNFLRTMNPRLKRPTPENLPDVFRYVQSQKKLRGLPGADATPWQERGPNNVGGRTRAIMFDPNDSNNKKVWAGGVTGGLWYNNDITSADSGWHAVDDFWDNIAITSIAADPNNSSIFYVGTGEGFGTNASRGAGIWKTTDGGSTWSQLSSTEEFYYVNDLVVRDESGTSVIYAGLNAYGYQGSWHQNSQGGYNMGLFRSTNGGSSFSQVLPNVSGGSGNYAAGDVKIGADNRIYVGSVSNVYGWGGGTVLYSDNGTSWTAVEVESSGGRVEVAVAASNSNYVYALCEKGYAVSGIYRSTNKGQSWSARNEPVDDDSGIPSSDFSRNQAWYDLVIAVDPNDEDVVLVGAINLHRSTNGGSNWTQISMWYEMWNMTYPYVHADQHAIVFRPGSSTEVLFGNDGGVFYASDVSVAANNTNAINARNNDYNVTQFYACAIHPDEGEHFFLAGAQDNGTQKFTNTGINATTKVKGGDGAYCFIDEDNPNIQIASYVYNVYDLSTDGGVSFNTSLSDDQNSGTFINTADYDSRQNCLYSGYSTTHIQRISGIGSGSSTTTLQLTEDMGADASIIKVSPYTTGSSTVFIGTDGGRIYKMTGANTGSRSSSRIGASAGFPTGSVSSIEFGSNENEILITFSNYGVSSVWYTTDGGSNWDEKEGDLPDMPVRWVLMNPSDSNEVILATEVGVWSTSNFQSASPNWKASNSGLSNVRVDMLRMRESDKEVIAATHGRGLFSSSAFAVPAQAVAPTAAFSADATSIFEAGTVNFTDASTGSPTSWSWTFEGVTPSTSTDQNPSVTYDSAGVYDVTLIVTNDEGSDTLTRSNYITVNEFTGVACETVTNWDTTYNYGYFGDESNGTLSGHHFQYSFTDFAEYYTGNTYPTITQMKIASAFATAANGNSYITIKLWEDDNGLPGNVIHSQDVLLSDIDAGYFSDIILDSAVAVDSNFFAGYTVNYDNSGDYFSVYQTNAPSSNTAYLTYNGGWYSYSDLFQGAPTYSLYLSLTACTVNPNAEDQIDTVFANFTSDVTSIYENGSVSFSDASAGSPTSWSWTFEGGTPSSSTAEKPTVTYTTAGEYDVTLIATNADWADTITLANYITVNEISGDVCESTTNWDTTYTYGYFGDDTTGTLSGHHYQYYFGDYAEYYTGNVYPTVTQMRLAVAMSTAGNANSYITVKVWEDNNGVPGAELHSQNVLLSDLDAGYFNDVVFDTAVAIGASFFAGYTVNYDNAGDYFSVYQTNAPSSNTAYLTYNGGWYSYSDLFQGNPNYSLYLSVTTCGEDNSGEALFAFDADSVCVGAKVAIIDSSVGTGIDYSWSFGDGANIASSSESGDQEISYSTSGTKTVQLIVSNNDGADTISQTIVVVDLPITSNIAGEDTVCYADGGEVYSVALSDNDFAWSVTGGTIVSGDGTNEITVDWDDSTSVGLIEVFETNSTGCIGDTVSFNVHKIDIAIDPIVGASAVCDADTIQAYHVTSSAAYEYHWSATNGVFTDNDSSQNVTVDWGADGTLSVYSMNNGCISDTVTLDISRGEVYDSMGINGLDTICSSLYGHTYQLTNGNDNYSYEWVVEGGEIKSSSQSSVTIDWNADASSNYVGVVSQEKTSGCLSDTIQLAITIEAPSSVELSGDAVICEGDTAMISLVDAVGTSTYEWFASGGVIESTSSESITVTVEDAQASFYVVETNQAGCKGDSVQFDVNHQIVATPEIIGEDSLCEGGVSQSFTLENNGATAHWSVEGAFVTSSSDTALNVNRNSDFKVSVYLETAEGCLSDVDSMNVLILSYPEVSLSLLEDTIDLSGSSAEAVISVDGYDDAYTYEIDLGDGVVSNNVSSSFSYYYTDLGSFDIVLTAYNGMCADSASTVLFVRDPFATDITNGVAQKFAVYPNPVVRDLHIDFMQSSDAVEIEIFNIAGASVVRNNMEDVFGGTSKSFDLGGLQPGAYLLQITTGGKAYKKQIVVQ